MNSTLTMEVLAKEMYEAYGLKAGWKTWDDKPMPTWDGIGDVVQGRWIASAERAMTIFRNLSYQQN